MNTRMYHLRFLPHMAVLLMTTLGGVSSMAQPSGVDSTFNAAPSTAITAGAGLQAAAQPDGKVVLFGPRLVVDGVAKSDVVRVNPDGASDPTFSYCGCGLSFVRNLMLAAGGKMIVAGGEGPNAKMIRLNSDGSIDGAFNAFSAGPPAFLGGAEFSVQAVQPDGKVLAMRRFSSMGFVSYTLHRYNADGSVDSSFATINIASGSPVGAAIRIKLLADGRFYLAVTSGGTGTTATLTRRNADGSNDGSWEVPSFQASTPPPAVSIAGIGVDSAGNVLVAGNWDTVNGVNRRNLVRLQSAGNVDLSFNSPTLTQTGTGVEVLSSGKILLSGRVDIAGIFRIFRLNSDGSPDNTFVMDAAVTNIASGWVVDHLDRIVFIGHTAAGIRPVRLLPDGALDGGFVPNVTLFGSVNLLARQSDGKVLIAGVYAQMNGIARAGFARVNADGTLDPTFDPGSGFSAPPSRMLVQPDGKILAVGDFGSYNGSTVSGLVRINSNGSIDNTFNVTVSSRPLGLSLQVDGKILISGSFSMVNGTGRNGVARLSTEGILDDTFNPTIGGATIRAILAQSDTKVMVAGTFSGVNGFNRANVARLNGDGSLDQAFNATGVSSLGDLWIQSDGKYVLGHGSTPTSLSRRNTDGSPDTGFAAPPITASSSSDTQIHSVVFQPDGSLLIGGRFDNVGQAVRPNITRLGPNGAFDVLFMPAGANGRVRSVVPDTTGKVVVGGNFNFIGNVTKPGVARLSTAPYRVRTPYDFDGDGRADFTVYRPSTGVWWELSSATGTFEAPVFGIAGDIPVPGDYDGDGKADEAIWRPSNGDWWYQSSLDGSHRTVHYGAAGDLPLPGDFDGDGKADFIIYRPSARTWYRVGSLVGEIPPFIFGSSGDQPVIGDFDGDGRVDPAIFRPSTGDWWYAASSASWAHRAFHWGATGDVPLPADYDGDGKTDFAVWRPSNRAWYIYKSSDQAYIIQVFGLEGDKPVAADYDGDGRADIAMFRPSTGIWHVLHSTAGYGGVQWGVSSDVAIPNAFSP